MIDISKLSKAKVLAALYNAAHSQGIGYFVSDYIPLPEEEATELLKNCTYFDYLKGRVMKVDLSGDLLDPHLYDRDNGEGAALRAIEKIEQ